MIKYNYTYNEETNKVERSISETYPDLEILNRGLKVGRKTEVILKGVKKAYEGKAEEPIIKIEEEWWDIQNSIQEKQDILNTISNLQRKTKTLEDGSEINLTNEELKTNSNKLEEILKSTEYEKINDYISVLEEEILELEKKRNIIEKGDDTEENEPHEWLMNYRGIKTPANSKQPNRPKVVVKIPKDIKKKLIAHDRDLKIRNLEDTVADLAKMNSLLMSFISAIYNALPSDIKNNLPDTNKELIDYAINKWPETNTRADRQLNNEGINLIDKLFQREVEIADIIDNLNSMVE